MKLTQDTLDLPRLIASWVIAAKARKELGWEPKCELKALIKEMVESDLELAKKEKDIKRKRVYCLNSQET